MEAYRPPAPGGWASVPDDGYFYQHLAYHLSEAGLAMSCVGCSSTSTGWRPSSGPPTWPSSWPISTWLPGDEAITLVRDALRLSAHHLARDPTLLRSQLHGRLLGVESPEIQGLLRRPSGRSPWLRCLTPSLTGPGGELILTLEGHADSVIAVAVTPDGTRAVSALRRQDAEGLGPRPPAGSLRDLSKATPTGSTPWR